VEDLARPRLATLLALVLALAAPAAADAAGAPHVDSLVRADGTTVIRFVAPQGEDNEVTMRVRAEELDPYKRQQGLREDTGVDFYDAGVDGLTWSGPLCRPQATGVGCDVAGSKVEIRVTLGDRDDFLIPEYDSRRSTRAIVNAGAGNDGLQVRGTARTAIDFTGGPGSDAVDYYDPSNVPYAFTEDALFNDGLGLDRIHGDVEVYLGGDGPDSFKLRGPGPHVVFGVGGDDTLVSGSGPDEFDGGYGGDPTGVDPPSSDTVTYAGRGAGVTVTLDGVADDGAPREGDEILPTVEHVVGTAHPDTLVGPAAVPDRRSYELDGGAGNDVLSGGVGTDLIDAGAGDDVVFTLAGSGDAIKCGAGSDLLVADRADLSRDCERVWRSFLNAAPAQRGHAVAATLAVPAPNATVTATLLSGAARLGARTATAGAGLRALAVPLDAAGVQALQTAGSLALTLRVQVAPAGRKALVASRPVTLSAG
jgi:Ca2+-binding RTX toxin-like protein